MGVNYYLYNLFFHPLPLPRTYATMHTKLFLYFKVSIFRSTKSTPIVTFLGDKMLLFAKVGFLLASFSAL